MMTLKPHSHSILGLVSVLLLFASTNLHAQRQIEWEHVYRGLGIGEANSIIQTSDGGYVIAGPDRDTLWSGFGYPFDTLHYKIVRTDATGNVLWDRTFQDSIGTGGGGNGCSIIQTNDGGFATVVTTVSGVTNRSDKFSKQVSEKVLVIKLSYNGTIEWQKMYGGSADEWASSIVQTSDGGFVVGGGALSTDGDLTGINVGLGGNRVAWIFKINSAGSIQWQHCYGGYNADEVESLIKTADNGFAIACWAGGNGRDVTGFHPGNSLSGFGAPDFWIVKLDSVGAIQWGHCYGGSGIDVASSIIQSADGGYAVVGSTSSTDGDVTGYNAGSNGHYDDAWILKLDSVGRIEWERALGGSNGASGNGVAQTIDGGFLMVGATGSTDGDVSGLHLNAGTPSGDVWLVQFDRTGKLLWQKCLGGSGTDGGNSIVATNDLSFAIAGYTNSTDGDVTGVGSGDVSDFWVVKLAGIPCTDIRVELPKTVLSARRGDTVRIPILALDTSARPLNIIDFTIGLNTDLLTPIGIDPSSGVFAGITPTRFIAKNDTLSVRLQLPAPVQLVADTLCVIECVVNLTDSFSTNLTLRRVEFSDPPFNSSCLSTELPTGIDSVTIFTYIPSCGDPTIEQAMQQRLPFVLSSLSPNPTNGKLTVTLTNVSKQAVVYELYDALGHDVQRGSFGEAVNTLDLNSLPSGSYYLRLAGSAEIQSRKIVVVR